MGFNVRQISNFKSQLQELDLGDRKVYWKESERLYGVTFYCPEGCVHWFPKANKRERILLEEVERLALVELPKHSHKE